MVKGTSRRVIVVDSPDPKLFEQAIFIVKNDVFAGEGVTPQQVLGEACRIAQGCAARRHGGRAAGVFFKMMRRGERGYPPALHFFWIAVLKMNPKV